LYGLPFIKVRVPKPTQPTFGNSFDPLPRGIPAGLQNNGGTFTRLITFTNSFAFDDVGGERRPRAISRVDDSYVPGLPFTLTSDDQPLLGRPMLPILTYDITLRANLAGLGAPRIPQPRGIRLVRAETLPDLANINPHVTTPVTDMVYLQQQDDPVMPPLLQGAWQPEQPFAIQRTEQRISTTEVITADKLLVSPVQFRPSGAETGQLRRFGQMVFEVSYADPRQASSTLLDDGTPPLIGNVAIVPVAQQAIAGASPAASQPLRITARVRDTGGSGVSGVHAVFTSNGRHWQNVTLLETSPGSSIYAATVQTTMFGNGIFAIVDARDKSGNMALYTAKGALSAAFNEFYLPLIRR
jgi:hypothetical protein